jgi:hypothetical protein
MTSKQQLAAYDREYFDHMDAMIEAREDEIWAEMQAEQRAKRCCTERDGWMCLLDKHDDERHRFTSASQNYVFT